MPEYDSDNSEPEYSPSSPGLVNEFEYLSCGANPGELRALLTDLWLSTALPDEDDSQPHRPQFLTVRSIMSARQPRFDAEDPARWKRILSDHLRLDQGFHKLHPSVRLIGPDGLFELVRDQFAPARLPPFPNGPDGADWINASERGLAMLNQQSTVTGRMA